MQSLMDNLLAHEAFAAGKPGGCRAFFRMQRMAGLRLLKRQLDGIEFVGCDLNGSHFTLSSLKTASFYCCNLTRVDLRGADLTRADMRGAVLRGADLYRANLDGADLRKAVLVTEDCDKEFASFAWLAEEDQGPRDGAVDFRDCALRGAKFSSAKLKGADFSGALLEGADLSNADLRGASFRGAVMTGVKVGGALLEGADMQGALRDPGEDAIARRAELLHAVELSDIYTRTHGKEGVRASFAGEDLRVLDKALVRKGLIGANMRGVCGVGVDFTGASLVGAMFHGADLRGANFTGALLHGVSFRDCNLKHAIFSKADLRAFEGAGGRRFEPSFEGADVTSARFDQAQFDPGFPRPDRQGDLFERADPAIETSAEPTGV